MGRGSLDGAPSWYWQVYADDNGPFVFPLPSITVQPAGVPASRPAGRPGPVNPGRVLALAFAAVGLGCFFLLSGWYWVSLGFGAVASLLAMFALRHALAAQRRLSGFPHVHFLRFAGSIPRVVSARFAAFGRGRVFDSPS